MEKADQQAFYDVLAGLYDLADDIICAVEREGNPRPDTEVRLAQPVIESAALTADELTDAFLSVARNGMTASHEEVGIFERAIRRVFSAILEFIAETEYTIDTTPSEVLMVESVIPGRAVERKKFEVAAILKKMVENYKALSDGPNQHRMQQHMTQAPCHAPLIESVRNLGVHTMLVGRACQDIGLVRSVEAIEPGARITGIGMFRASDVVRNPPPTPR